MEFMAMIAEAIPIMVIGEINWKWKEESEAELRVSLWRGVVAVFCSPFLEPCPVKSGMEESPKQSDALPGTTPTMNAW